MCGADSLERALSNTQVGAATAHRGRKEGADGGESLARSLALAVVTCALSELQRIRARCIELETWVSECRDTFEDGRIGVELPAVE